MPGKITASSSGINLSLVMDGITSLVRTLARRFTLQADTTRRLNHRASIGSIATAAKALGGQGVRHAERTVGFAPRFTAKIAEVRGAAAGCRAIRAERVGARAA